MFANTLKTTALLGGLGALIVLVAGLLGGGSTTALLIGLVLALVTVGGSYWFSGSLALRSAHATIIEESDAPEFFGLVRDLAGRAGLPMPKVAISPSEQPNAFATGRNPKHAVVCATVGLLRQMPRDELEGVMAHELMHVKHRDILIGSVAAAIATAISFIANMALWSGMFGGGDDDDRPNPIVLLAASILAPLAAGLLQMAISRSREFDADRGAAELIGTGQPLAGALRRIDTMAHQIPMAVNPSQASAWIHNPLAEAHHPRRGVDMARLFSTHPATEERIARLMAMTPA
ncbi:MAG TPA: zinc metalloprotease HtpX [Acidimicrobiales bacterium]|nr:zinc metalloprotease HtpX [Acidimicrobiales bacterium]